MADAPFANSAASSCDILECAWSDCSADCAYLW